MAAVLCALLPVGCGDGGRTGTAPAHGQSPTNESARSSGASAAPVAASPAGVTIRARVHPSLDEFAFTLVATGPAAAGEPLHVTAIEVRRGSDPAPVQTIAGLATETPVVAGVPPLGVLDMNFDGYADLRLIELQPAGPDVPYLNWLFDPAAGQFVESPALNDIAAPVFDQEKREIRSDWRDGPTRYGTDVFVFENGTPVAVRRETKEFSRPGRYLLRVLRRAGDAWKETKRREVREP